MSMPWEDWIADVAERLNRTPEEVLQISEHRHVRSLLYDTNASPAEAADFLVGSDPSDYTDW